MTKRSSNNLPGQFSTRFVVDVYDPGISTGDDGRSPGVWMDAGAMLSKVTYLGDLERHDGRWSLAMQWIDANNQAHKYYLPHPVVERLYQALGRMMVHAKRERAQRGAITRRQRAESSAIVGIDEE